MSDLAQKLKLIEGSDDEDDDMSRTFDLTKINNILSQARNAATAAEGDSNSNIMDPMQNASLASKIHEIKHMEFQLVTGLLKIREENMSQILDMVDQCLKYLMWKGSPFTIVAKMSFLQFINFVYNKVRPADGCEDQAILSLWKKFMDHLLDSTYVKYVSETWEQLMNSIARFSPDTLSSELWKGLNEEEIMLVNLFSTLMGNFLTLVPNVKAPEIWKKISDTLFLYVVKCLDSRLIGSLSNISHPLHTQLIIGLLSVSFNMLNTANEEFPDQIRQQMREIISNFLASREKPETLHLISLLVFSLCLPTDELKENVSNGDIALLLDVLLKTGGKSCSLGTVVSVPAYELMESIERLIGSKGNMQNFLAYGKKGETDLITLTINGVKSGEPKLQAASLKILKTVIEEKSIMNQLKSDVNLIAALEVRRAGAGPVIKQLAVDIHTLIRGGTKSEDHRQKLESSSCITWTGDDVLKKIQECGYSLTSNIDMKDCDGKWLIDLLVLRREDNRAYFNMVKSRFGIEADQTSIDFNRSLRRLEESILSENSIQRP